MNKIYHFPENIETSGPYTPAVEIEQAGTKFLYISGQGTRDPKTGEKFLGDIQHQTALAMNNLKTIVTSCEYQMEDLLKVTIFLTNMADGPVVNSVYQTYFPKDKYPARSTVAVAALPGKMNIEIEAIACKSA